MISEDKGLNNISSLFMITISLLFSFVIIIDYSSLISAFFAVGACLIQISIRAVPITKNKILICLGTLLVLDVLSNIYIESNLLSHTCFMISSISLICAMRLFCKNKYNLDILLWTLFFVLFIGGPIVGGFYLITGVQANQGELFSSTIISNARLSNPNYTALNMIMCIMLSGYFYQKKASFLRLLLFVISWASLVLTFSRTGIIFAALGCAVIWITSENKIRSRISKRSFAIAIVVIAFAVLSFKPITRIVSTYLLNSNVNTLFRYKSSATLFERINQWKAAAKIIFNGNFFNMLLGYGDNSATEMGAITGRVMSAHSFIFGRLSENGLIGGTIAIILYVLVFGTIIRNIKHVNACGKWLVVFTGVIYLCYIMLSIVSWELIIVTGLLDIFVYYTTFDNDNDENEIL